MESYAVKHKHAGGQAYRRVGIQMGRQVSRQASFEPAEWGIHETPCPQTYQEPFTKIQVRKSREYRPQAVSGP